MNRLEAIFKAIPTDGRIEKYNEVIQECDRFLECSSNWKAHEEQLSGFVFKGLYALFNQLINDTKSGMQTGKDIGKISLITSILSLLDEFSTFLEKYSFLATQGMKFFVVVLRRIGALYSMIIVDDFITIDLNISMWMNYTRFSEILKNIYKQAPATDSNLHDFSESFTTFTFLLNGKLKQEEFLESMKYCLISIINTMVCLTADNLPTLLKEKYNKLMNYFFLHVSEMYLTIEKASTVAEKTSKKKSNTNSEENKELTDLLSVESSMIHTIFLSHTLHADMMIKFFKEYKTRILYLMSCTQKHELFTGYSRFFQRCLYPTEAPSSSSDSTIATTKFMLPDWCEKAYVIYSECSWKHYDTTNTVDSVQDQATNFPVLIQSIEELLGLCPVNPSLASTTVSSQKSTSRSKKATVSPPASANNLSVEMEALHAMWYMKLQLLQYKLQLFITSTTAMNNDYIPHEVLHDKIVPMMKDTILKFGSIPFSKQNIVHMQLISLLAMDMIDLCTQLQFSGSFVMQIDIFQALEPLTVASNASAYSKELSEIKSLLSLHITVQESWNHFHIEPFQLSYQEGMMTLQGMMNDWTTCSSTSSSALVSSTLLIDDTYSFFHRYLQMNHSLIICNELQGQTENELFKGFRDQKLHVLYLEQLLNTLSTSTNHHIRDIKQRVEMISLRCWMCLSCAKVCWFVQEDLKSAFKYAKLALSYTISPINTPRTKGNENEEDGNHNEQIDIDKMIAHLEVLLFLAELYEYIGKSARCYDYLAECQTILQLFSSKNTNQSPGEVNTNNVPVPVYCSRIVGNNQILSWWQAVYSLHSIRLWYRMGNDINKELAVLLPLLTNTNTKTKNSSEWAYLRDVFSVIATTVVPFRKQINTSIETAHPALLSEHKMINMVAKEKLSYRDLLFLWGITSVHHGSQQLLQIKSVPNGTDNASRNVEIIQKLYGSPSLSVPTNTLIEYLQGSMHHDQAKQFFTSVMNKLITEHIYMPHDRVRDIRRTMCLYAMEETKLQETNKDGHSYRQSNDLFACLLGFSSCFVSTEQSMTIGTSSSHHNENDNNKKDGVVDDRTDYYSDWSILIQDALLSPHSSSTTTTTASLQMQDIITSVLDMNYLSSKDTLSLRKNNLSFICIDHYQEEVILGSIICDGKQLTPVVLAIPSLYTELTSLCSTWQDSVQENNSNLKSTAMDLSTAKALTEKQKREWWKERNSFDTKFKDLLEKMDGLLAPWKSILAPEGMDNTNSGSAVVGDEFDELDDAIDRLVSMNFGEEGGSSKGRDSSSVTVPAMNVIDYENAKVTDLRVYCKERGLSNVGRKQELIDRLQEHEKQQQQPQSKSNTMQLTASESTKSSSSSSSSSSSIHQTLFAPSTNAKTPFAKSTKKSIIPPPSTAVAPKIGGLTLFQDDLPNHATSTGEPMQGHTFLFLDESLQCIPIECIPYLRNRSCSRMCSLAVLLDLHHRLATLSSTTSTTTITAAVSPSISVNAKSWYAVDIENNLPNTQELMTTFFTPYRSSYHWTSVIGAIPTLETIKEYQSTSNLFIYCGHGGGEKLQLNRCYTSSTSSVEVQAPATMLWGCSSGKLSLKGKHDPLGPILSHLLHGAYFVVGNLWDVTDGDIDKLSMECMRHSLPVPAAMTVQSTVPTTVKGTKKSKASVQIVIEEEHTKSQEDSSMMVSLPMSQSILQARNICKLKYAVGCAPVIYGFPVSITE